MNKRKKTFWEKERRAKWSGLLFDSGKIREKLKRMTPLNQLYLNTTINDQQQKQDKNSAVSPHIII